MNGSRVTPSSWGLVTARGRASAIVVFALACVWSAVGASAAEPARASRARGAAKAAPEIKSASAAKHAPQGAMAAPEAATREPIRTLDAITIEGEVPLPQILFIALNDVPRYPDTVHRRFVATCVAVGGETILPTRIRTSTKTFREASAERSPADRGPQP